MRRYEIIEKFSEEGCLVVVSHPGLNGEYALYPDLTLMKLGNKGIVNAKRIDPTKVSVPVDDKWNVVEFYNKDFYKQEQV